MKDKNGLDIKVGDEFLYQVGEPNECKGEVFDCGGVDVIKWDDNQIIAVKDFYWQATDQEILQRL